MKAVWRYLRTVRWIVRKDFQVEWRGRQGLPVMLVFALMVVILFNYALQLSPDLQAGLAAGLLWVSLAFASTLGLNRSISLERENMALDGLLLVPVDRSAVFFGKSLSNFLFTFMVALVLLRHLPDATQVGVYVAGGGANAGFAAAFGWLLYCGRGETDGPSCG